MDKVKNLMTHGADLSDAVRIALGGRTFGVVADAQDVNAKNLISVLNGKRVPSAAEINALVSELGGSFEEWRDLIANAAADAVRAVTV
jgi:hypothetical protein